MSQNTHRDVSVIVPVFNEEESIPLLAAEIETAFRDSGWQWECLWVDDGSNDGTLLRLRELHEKEPRQRFLTLNLNCGQSAALAAGFRHASGQILATLDGDLQNDPADLPRLIRELETSGVHMVNGIRIRRRDDWVRRITSRVANGLRNWVTGDRVTDVGCSTRAFCRECVEEIPVFRGMHRFLPTLVKMQGYRVREIPVNHRPRKYGETKYGINNRLWVAMIDTLGIRWLQARWVQRGVERRWDEQDEESTPHV